MRKIKCIIIEDEPLAVKILRDYIQQTPQLELTEVFREAVTAGQYLQHTKTDLLFLDIHLPRVKGLDFLRTLINPPVCILTTAYHQYALEGFELSVADYLMKPISLKRFTAAVHKSIKLMPAENPEQHSGSPVQQAIFLNVNRRKVKILLNEILYVESKREYVQVVTTSNKYLSKLSTAELESMLPPEKFKRIHRSFIIATAHIQTYNKETVEINGLKIPIGKKFKNGFTQ